MQYVHYNMIIISNTLLSIEIVEVKYLLQVQYLYFVLFFLTEIPRTFTLVTDQFPIQGVSTQTRH